MFRRLKDLWQRGAPNADPVPEERSAVEQAPPPHAPARASVPRPTVARASAARTHEGGSDWRSYDDVAHEYDQALAPHTSRPVAELLDLSEAAPGMRVLDVGTGTGIAVELSAGAVGPTGTAIGVDAAPMMLRVARAARPTVNLAASEVLDLPFADATFDLVLANFALPYFTKLDTAIYEIARVIRPHGRLLVSVYGAGEDDLSKTWRRLAGETVGVEVLRAGVRDEMPWAEHLADPTRLEEQLRRDGFRPVEIHRRQYRLEMTREDYIVGQEIEAIGRFVRRMLGPPLWHRFRERARATYAERFPERIIDFRDVLLAVATKRGRST